MSQPTTGQRTLLAIEACPGATSEQLAATANVSTRTIMQVKTACRAGLSDRIANGELTPNKAERIALGADPQRKPNSQALLTVAQIQIDELRKEVQYQKACLETAFRWLEPFQVGELKYQFKKMRET